MGENQIRSNLLRVKERIAKAAERVGRDPAAVRLVAVTKAVPLKAIREVLEAGQLDLGENRVQELKAKDEALHQLFGGWFPLRWHMIGYLQTNKVRPVVARCTMIQSVDRFTVAQAISQEAQKQQRRVPILIEVNIGGEDSKAGVSPEKAAELVAAVAGLPGLQVMGLMTIPPPVAEPEEARPYFRRLRELAEEIAAQRLPGVEMQELSMGMSHDFEVAVEEGATIVRVGTAIFGPRERG